jgi:hypothetical protein
MKIKKRWSIYNKEVAKNQQSYYAVYELANIDKQILYIGEGHLKERLIAHLPDGSEPVVTACFYRYEFTNSKTRCVQRQNKLLEEYRKHYKGENPPFNTKSKN